MNLLDLPPELIMLIAESLDTLSELNNLTRTSRVLHHITTKLLYTAMDKNAVLRWAARNGRSTLLTLVLDMGASIDAPDSDERTALHWATTYAHDAHLITRLEHGQEIHAVVKSPLHTVPRDDEYATPAKILLDRGADIGARPWFRGRPVHVFHAPLHWATACGNVAAVELLLDRGAQIEQKGGMVRYTPLILAAINDHESVVRVLLQRGADVRATTMWNETALHWASWAGHEGVAAALLEYGAPVEDLGSDAQTPLIEAARENHKGLARILLKHGANVNAHNVDHDTPLNIAAQRGFQRMVALLLEHGADLTIKNHTRSPLHAAAYMGHESIVALLLDAGADIDEHLEHDGYNLLHTAILGDGGLPLIQLLLDRGVQPTDTTATGQTAVSLAHTHKKHDLLRDPDAFHIIVKASVQLLDAHAVPATHYLTDALHAACSAGLTDSARILIAAGADVNAPAGDPCLSPLLCTVASGNEATVRLLLAAEAHVDDAHDAGGCDACGELGLAMVGAERVAIVRALLEGGADVNCGDEWGQTALHRVVREGEEGGGGEVVRCLMGWGANPDQSDCEGCTVWDAAGEEGWARRALMEAGVADPYRHWKEAMEEMGQ
ncbi:uncharacterized protein LAJ45_09502 [Morchella importuna]|uniref:uncharacterized protein n=1 Tax=Morchella importuna TaxID=1174673 RepID=UPI001E8D4D7F|nr:uncharacterized protein LAJ45_09502 [Morchella importuna]KAH8146556.1 hypothetical protein LAJ45_09502 [Morchella importuna]